MIDFSGIELLRAQPNPAIIIDNRTTDASLTYDFQQHVVFRNDAVDDLHIKDLSCCHIDQIISGRHKKLVTEFKAVWTILYIRNIVVFTKDCRCSAPVGVRLTDRELYDIPLPLVTRQEQKDHADLILNFQWETTALGPRELWDPILQCLVDYIMVSPSPTAVVWGPELVLLYNTPYRHHIGDKHPRIFGAQYLDAWSEIATELEPIVRKAYKGEGQHVVDHCLLLHRHGYTEETYYTYSLVPLRGSRGHIVGFTIPCMETTLQTLYERRAQALRHLDQALLNVDDEDQFYAKLGTVLRQNLVDLPLMAIYASSSADGAQDGTNQSQAIEDPKAFKRRFLHGSSLEQTRLPENLILHENELRGDQSLEDCTRKAFLGQDIVAVPTELVSSLFAGLTDHTWNESFVEAFMFSLVPIGTDQPRAIVIIGYNPRKRYDEHGARFLDLVRHHLAAGMGGFLLRDDERRRQKALDALRAEKDRELYQLLDYRTKELRETEGKFARLCDVTVSAIAVVDVKTKLITYVNDAWYHISGHPRDSSPNNFQDSIHPEDVEHVLKCFEKSLQEPSEFEFRWKKPTTSGLPRWALSLSSPEPQPDGQELPRIDGGKRTGSVLYAMIDISDRKALEELLRKEASDAIEIKKQLEYFIDMTSHELRNPLGAIMHSIEMLHASMTKLSRDIMDQIHDKAKRMHVEGTLSEINETNHIIEHCSNHMKRLIDDTLTLSKLDSHLVQLDPTPFMPVDVCKLVLSMFAAEFQAKNIKCVLQTGTNLKNKNVTLLADVSRVSQILINLITNAIKFSIAEPGRDTITITIDCTVERPVFSKNQDLKTRKHPFDRLTRVLSASDDDIPNRRFLVISVADNGIGMSPSELDSLFQRFSQAKPRTHTKYGGSGCKNFYKLRMFNIDPSDTIIVGLYISKMLAARLGGEMAVSSVEGQGSTFMYYVSTEYLPSDEMKEHNNKVSDALMLEMQRTTALAKDELNRTTTEQTARRLSLAPSSNHEYTKRSLLIVEDNLINQKLMCKQFLNLGWDVATANDGQQAVEYIQQTSFGDPDSVRSLDICLMDCEMPVMDGLTATRAIRKLEKDGLLYNHVPIIAVTANARDEQRKSIMDSGVDEVVSKPYKLKSLVEQIESVLQSLSIKAHE